MNTNDRGRQVQRVAQIGANHFVFEEVLFSGATCIAVLSFFLLGILPNLALSASSPDSPQIHSCLFVFIRG